MQRGMTDVARDWLDWIDHLRIRPNRDGTYGHPGRWTTRGDSSDSAAVRLIQRFDSAVVGPAMCRLGYHRWISMSASAFGSPWETSCWYCSVEKGKTKAASMGIEPISPG